VKPEHLTNEFAAQFPLPALAVQAPMAVEENNNNAAAEHNDDAVAVAPIVIENNDALEDVAADADPHAGCRLRQYVHHFLFQYYLRETSMTRHTAAVAS
jgi:hypothetical protein